MTNTKYDYVVKIWDRETVRFAENDLQAWLTEMGSQGWRLIQLKRDWPASGCFLTIMEHARAYDPAWDAGSPAEDKV